MSSSASTSASRCWSTPRRSRATTSGWSARSGKRASASRTRASRTSTSRRGASSTALIRQLATCRWVAEHQNVIITGATGIGKTYLACALAQQACRLGYRVVYRRVPRLLEELALAHADGSYTRLLARLARVDVLVLDDWGLAPLSDQERRDMLEVVEDRDGTRSTIITSQLPVANWHDHLGDPTVADAICDRVLNRTHRLSIKGPSKRGGRHRYLNAPNAHLTAQDGRSARSRCGDLRDQDGRNAQPDTCRAGGRTAVSL